MERTIAKIILALIFVTGVFGIWVLRGRPSAFKDEFSGAKGSRNTILFLILVAAAIASIIYINNR